LDLFVLKCKKNNNGILKNIIKRNVCVELMFFYKYAVPTGLVGAVVFRFLQICRPYGTGLVVLYVVLYIYAVLTGLRWCDSMTIYIDISSLTMMPKITDLCWNFIFTHQKKNVPLRTEKRMLIHR